VAIFGAGRAGHAHAGAVAQNTDVRLVAVFDTDPDRASAFAEQHGCEAFSTSEAVLRREDVDLVMIALPNFLHAGASVEAASAGKHVFLEKPMADTLEECDQIIAAVEKAGVHLLVAHSQRYFAATVRARELLQGGELGQPVFATDTWYKPFGLEGRLPWFRERATGGGMWLMNGAHMIDRTCWVLDTSVESVQAWIGSPFHGLSADDANLAFLHLRNGLRAVIAHTGYRDRGVQKFRYHPALDGIRGVAVLAAIAYHDNYGWMAGGFLGVDMFFVLSGFLITTLLVIELRQHGTIRFAQFWARRARRLLPAVLVVLAFVAFFTYFVAVPWQRGSIRSDMLSSLLYVANWRFIFNDQGYFAAFSEASPLRHMWSLAIEEQYYLVWPVVVFVCIKLARGSLRLLAVVCAIGVALSVYAMRARFQLDNPSAAYYATDARAHTILIGALLGIGLLIWSPGRVARLVLAALGVVAAVVVVIRLHDTSATTAGFYRGGSFFFALVTAALIAGALQPGLLSAVLAFRPLAWIGTISYGLYLWHWPIDVWLIPSRVPFSGNALNLLRLLVTFGLATLTFYVVERPIRTRTWRPRITAAAFVPAIAIAMVAILFVFGAGGGGLTPLRQALGVQADVVAAAPVVSNGTVGSPATARGGGAEEQPPSYIWGYGDPLICGPPRPNETQEATTAATGALVPRLPASVRNERVLLVGDSTACSLWPGLDAVGRAEGIRTDQGSVFGCGVASGQVTTTRDEAITPHSSRCDSLVDVTLHNAFVRMQPSVVVWMSIWEKSDLVVGGDKILVAGTPEWQSAIDGRMDAALDRLTATGARVVMVTEAAPGPNPAADTDQVDHDADTVGYARLTDLQRRFQARHRDKVTIVDLASQVCPSGSPCPSDVDGMQIRPDGHHFTPSASTWAASWLYTQMFGTS
jgi:peptidoglycan/LPS O-acetylase OafA/YrhL